MRITIVTNDTRGGVEPYVALGIGLQRSGHQVQVVVPQDLVGMVTDADLAAAPLTGSIREGARVAAAATRQGPVRGMRTVAAETTHRLNGWTREVLDAAEGCDALTGGVGGMVVGLGVADRLGVPFVPTHLQPVGAPTGAYPGVMTAGVPPWLGRPGRHLSHHVSEAAIWAPFRPAVTAARRHVLGLSGRSRATRGQPVLYGLSRHVVAPPRGIATGYWFLPPGPAWTPPAGLEAFLAAGGPVVAVGFGSMPGTDPEATTRLVVEAVRAAGARTVLLTGWGGLADIDGPDDVYVCDVVPHRWLFARVAATVHHGGAGTTAAALRAGIPTVVVPHSADQPFWAARVTALGVGPAPVHRRRLTGPRLVRAVHRALTDTSMRARAAELGARIRAEDGVAAAVAVFDDLAARR